MKKLTILMLVAVLAVGLVVAAEPGEVEIADAAVDLGEYLSEGGANVDLQSGNVTTMNISARVSTFVWAGLIGDVGGDIVLGTGTGAGEILYNWSANGRVVYASEAAAIDWSDGNIVPLEVGNIPTYVNTGAADDYTNTFAADAINLNSAIYGTIANVPYVETWNNVTAATWRTFSFEDDAADEPVWAAEVQEGGTAFNGATVDFQMIVPENGVANDVAVTPYYLWAELV